MSDSLQGKKDKLIEKIEKNAGTPGIYLITLAANKEDLLDIIPTSVLLQPVVHGLCPMIVGLAKGWEDAVEMAGRLVLDSYRKTGDFHVQKYLEGQLERGEACSFHYPMERLKPRKRLFFGKK